MSSQEITPKSSKELNKLWKIKPKDFFDQRLDVLAHVVKADTSRKFTQHVPGLNPSRRGRISLLPNNPNIGLQPDVLIRLKKRAEFSLRQDFASLGKAQVADIFINKKPHHMQ